MGISKLEFSSLPVNWKLNALSNFWNVIDCKHITAQFTNNGFPLASICEVQSKYVDLSKANCTTNEYYKELIDGGRKPEVGDLIFSRNATVGEVSQVTKWHPPFAMGQDVCILKRKTQAYSSDFMQEVLKSPFILKQLQDLMVGSTFKRVNIEQIRNFQIPFPPEDEQNAIATVLCAVDELIFKFSEFIVKKRDIKQATMQQILTGKTRLPGFSGKWDTRRLKDLAEIQRGASPRPIDDPVWFTESSDIGWVRISDVTSSVKFLESTDQKLSPEGIKASRFVKSENLIMSICATVGRPIITKIDVCIHDGFVVFKNPKASIEYLYYFLSSIEGDWSKMGQTGSQMNLNTALINNTTIRLPKDLGEQAVIAEMLGMLDRDLHKANEKLEKLKLLKQGMIQELLTGRIRLI